MDFKTHLETAWKLTLQQIVPLLILTLAVGVVSALSVGILAPVVLAAYTQSILMLTRSGREPKVQDLFTEMKLFLPLLGFGFALFLVTIIGFSMFLLPGIVIVCGVTYCCLYVMPLMTDRRLPLVDAVRKSFQTVTGSDWLEHVIAAVLYIGICAIGGSVAVGWLFTLPFATVFLTRVYEEKMAAIPPVSPTDGMS